ncbi:TROVE domain-containing protein [Streptomyces sp. TBY4]|uniref:TROVE domain-containing protein n=1 Tax=Streptomyces sp. TBY4 TaxID=2962030 RepID=UPI0035AF5B3A
MLVAPHIAAAAARTGHVPWSHPHTTWADPLTYEGGPGFVREPREELFLLAVGNFVSQRTFYESGPDRDERYTRLVGELALEDPAWTAGLLRWLRGEGNMRTASLTGAAAYVRARLAAGSCAGPSNRSVIDSVLQRADEPGELLAHWISAYGRSIPQPVKRGIADAVRRLYSSRSLLKYDTASKAFRFSDVLNLVHATPDPAKPWQGELFRHALDRRHHPQDAAPPPRRPSNAEEVARSRQFPFRYLAARRHAPSARWSAPLELALSHSLGNVPALNGRTLILVDRSGSMFFDTVSERSTLTRADAAAVFGTALAMRAEEADLVEYGWSSAQVPYRSGEPVLDVLERFRNLGGTDTTKAVRAHYQGHDRVLIVTDEQTLPSRRGLAEPVPADIPVYTWNLAGYQPAHGPGGPNRHTFGGPEAERMRKAGIPAQIKMKKRFIRKSEG